MLFLNNGNDNDIFKIIDYFKTELTSCSLDFYLCFLDQSYTAVICYGPDWALFQCSRCHDTYTSTTHNNISMDYSYGRSNLFSD